MKSNPILMGWFVGCLLLFETSAMALTVIQASKNTEPLAPYVTSMGNDETPANSIVLTPEQVTNLKPYPVEASQFPVKSQLTVGKVETSAVNLPQLTQPLFVIGDDPFSIHWLEKNSVELKKRHAIGLMTNVDSEERYKAIEQETGWTLLPVSLDDIETLAPVTHLPFLLTSQWLEQ